MSDFFFPHQAREWEQSLRVKVAEEEQASTVSRQARAEVEGRLSQREKEVCAFDVADDVSFQRAGGGIIVR